MTIKKLSYPPFPAIGGKKTCYDKQSPTDKPGMKGDRAEITGAYDYAPDGLGREIHRARGSLRMKRGDTKLMTLSNTYPEFWWLCGVMNSGNPPAALTLADARRFYGKHSITGLRKAIRKDWVRGFPKAIHGKEDVVI